ncbi:hypothetical protein M2137_002459 [Parabacteroides sp. PFB2-10]|nr:hypothetical protein [Parabacteroides sp. PFB2-10]
MASFFCDYAATFLYIYAQICNIKGVSMGEIYNLSLNTTAINTNNDEY